MCEGVVSDALGSVSLSARVSVVVGRSCSSPILAGELPGITAVLLSSCPNFSCRKTPQAFLAQHSGLNLNDN